MQICDMYNYLGNVYEVSKLYKDAKFCYTKILTIMANNQDKQYRLIGTIYYYLGRIYSERKKHGEALTNFAKALNWKWKNCGNDHIEVAKVLHAIGKIHFAMGDIDSSVSQFYLSLASKKRYLVLISKKLFK